MIDVVVFGAPTMARDFCVVGTQREGSDRVQLIVIATISNLLLPLPHVVTKVKSANMRPSKVVSLLPTALREVPTRE